MPRSGAVKRRYFALEPYHYSDGVVAKGTSAALSPATAAAGVAAGTLVQIEQQQIDVHLDGKAIASAIAKHPPESKE